jgi:hypothetical protein
VALLRFRLTDPAEMVQTLWLEQQRSVMSAGDVEARSFKYANPLKMK